jgi:hypothetical protein
MSDETQVINDFAQGLLAWAIEENITQRAMDRIVTLLKKYSQISKSAMREGLIGQFPLLDNEVVKYAVHNNVLRKEILCT